MGGRLCVAAAALLLIFLVSVNWFSSNVLEFPVGVTGDSTPAARKVHGWVEQLLLLPGVSEGGQGQASSTQGSSDAAWGTALAVDWHGFPPLIANLSECHATHNFANTKPVYCCPPRKYGDETEVAFQFPDPAVSPTRVRRPAHLLDAEYIAKYERAVAIMKSLPSDHPHNFWRQANNHCLYCTGSYDQVNSTSQFMIHQNWLFFPWHRAFIYFHERILGKLIGDDTFALPYWNWDVPEGMVMPDFYTTSKVLNDSERLPPHLPPCVLDFNYGGVESGLGREEQVASNQALLHRQMQVSGAKNAELFMGCKRRAGLAGECEWSGTLERAPHSPIHFWVGSGFNPGKANMGAFYSSAGDAIFYAHHNNVDRMWDIWKKLGGHDFTEPDWLETSFNFYDENMRFIRIKVRDLLDSAKLGYTFEEAPLPWLNSRPEPAVPPVVARAILKEREEQEVTSRIRMPATSESGQLSSTVFGPEGRRVLDDTVSTRVLRPKRRQTQGEEEVLTVYGIRMKRDTYAKFDVFVNLVADERTTGPRSTEFAGTFVNVPLGATRVDKKNERGTAAGTTLKLAISGLLADLEAEGDESVWVSLVPRGGTGLDVTVDGVRIEYLS